MKRDKLILHGTVREDIQRQPIEFYRAGYLLVAIPALLLLFPQFRHPRFFIAGAFFIIAPFALVQYFRPRCVVTEESFTIRRGRRTIRSFRLDALTAIGRYQENGMLPQLFLCTVPRKELRRFAYAHGRDCENVAKNYGYAEQRTEAEQWRVALTVYLWRKGSIRNQSVCKIELKANSWEEFDRFCRERRIELHDIVVP